MNCKRKIFFFLLIIGFFTGVKSQDKIVLRNGSVIQGNIVSINDNEIIYKDTLSNSPIFKLKKDTVLLTEDRFGKIYMFSKVQKLSTPFAETKTLTIQPNNLETRSQRKERKMKEWKVEEEDLSNNILGFSIPDLLFGRLTISFERLLSNKSIGILVPLSLTYDGIGALAEFSANNSNSNSINSGTNTGTTNSPVVKRTVGTGVVSGLDINYYYDLKPRLKYFFGPRVRYGTDMTLGGIEGLSVQIQNGLFSSRGKKRISALSFGFGFVKLSERYGRSGRFDSKQVYPWASFTWRLGFRL